MNMKDIYVVIDGRKYLPVCVNMDSNGAIDIKTSLAACIPGSKIPGPMELMSLMALKETVQHSKHRSSGISIKNVLFNPPATIVFWSDGTKSVVKAQNGEPFDAEKGLAMAILKRIMGNKGRYYNDFAKWCKNYTVSNEKADEPVTDENNDSFALDFDDDNENKDIIKDDLNSVVLPDEALEMEK